MPGTVSEVSATLVASTMRRPARRREHALLLRHRQAREQRQDLDVARVGPAREARGAARSPVSRISRSPGRNTRMSPGPLAPQVLGRVDDRVLELLLVVGLARVAASVVAAAAGSAPRPDTCGPTLRSPAPACPPVPKCRAKRSASSVADVMITLRSGAAREQLLQVAQQEIDVEAALVRLVDDDRVVGGEQRGRPASRRAGCRRSSA